MKKCTKIALSLSLLVCGDAIAMGKKNGKKQSIPSPAVASSTLYAQWPSPSESTAKPSKDTTEARKTAECKAKFNGVVAAIKNVNVAHAEARVLNHPDAFRADVVPSIAGARASLKNVSAPVQTPAEAAPEYSNEQLTALRVKIDAFNEKRDAQQQAQETATCAEEAHAAVAMAPEAETVTTEVAPAAATTTEASVAAPAVEAEPAAQVAATSASTSDKSKVITTWMKLACARSTNLAKAIYFMQNTAHRNLETRKEIGSRLGDAITETVAALNGIHTLCYGKSEIQSADEIDRLQEPLVQDLETALTLAILPAEGEKQIQVDTGLLKLAAETLQKLNRHEKHQAVRVINATTARAAKHKTLAFLIQANMESRGDRSLDGELSDDEYNGTLDMLNIVAEETQKEATDKE